MKILIKFIHIIIILNISLSLSAQLDTLYIEDFTDQEYPLWELSEIPTEKIPTSGDGLIFESNRGNSFDTLTSPTLNLNIYEDLLLVTNDTFQVSTFDKLTLSISEDGGDSYNINFNLKSIESDTINLSDILSSFDNIKFKYTIEFNGPSTTKYWEIKECQVLGRNILGGTAKVSTDTDDNDRERFYYECLSIGEEVNISLVLTNDFDDKITIESLDIFVTAVNHINWNSSTVPIEIISNQNDIVRHINGMHNQDISLNTGEKAKFNIPLTIEGPESDVPYNNLNFIFKIAESPYIIRGDLPTKIGNCCQEEAYTVHSHNEPLPYFLKTNSYIEINNTRPLDTNEKSILTAIDYILLEPKDTSQFISIFNQFPDSQDIFITKMSIDTCITPQHPSPVDENDPEIGKVSNKTKFKNTSVHIYPNPTTETLNFNITLETENEFINIEIINTVGSIVLKKKMDNWNSDFFKINTNSLPNGLYYVKIYNSKFVETKKFYKR